MMSTFPENIRDITGDDAELRQSMQSFGWYSKFPALADENGVILVGHRRLKIAKELHIDPVIEYLKLGTGEQADAERFKLAIISNIGGKPMTKEDRKRIAEHLYGKRQWTMQRIADALKVHKSTIADYLANCPPGGQSKPVKTMSNPKGAGRPKGSHKSNGSAVAESGARIRIPDGYASLSEATRAGIKMEQEKMPHPKVLKQIGLSHQTFAVARDIVLLHGKELSRKDTAIVQRALEQLDQTRRVKGLRTLIEPIAHKVWGKKGHRYKSDQNRVVAFGDSISFVLTTCTAIVNLEVPPMGREQYAEVLAHLDEAIKSLKILHQQVERSNDHGK